MSEEEKKAIETVEGFIKYYKTNEQTGNRANLDVLREECQAIEFILNKYDVTQKELNNLKEIEKSHREVNEKLRVELEQEKEKNKKLNEYIQGLTIATGIALNGKTLEVSKKTLYELENTMKIEQKYIPETNSYKFRVI